jgi:hypothetical protein
MKKVILCALVLAVSGVLVNSVLAQEDERYVVTYVRSSTTTTLRSATVVTVVNQSSRACNVRVEWFLDNEPGNPVCSRVPAVSSGTARQFCSRNLPLSITRCTDICEPPLTSGLIGNQGKAIVSSTDVFECSLLAVEARVYYTTGPAGPSPANDTAISAISNSKVVFFGEGNLGD